MKRNLKVILVLRIIFSLKAYFLFFIIGFFFLKLTSEIVLGLTEVVCGRENTDGVNGCRLIFVSWSSPVLSPVFAATDLTVCYGVRHVPSTLSVSS